MKAILCESLKIGFFFFLFLKIFKKDEILKER